MKSTGIVRRIDELGRIVIPKEIRRTMHIHEGDPLEIYTEKDGITLKKYSALNRMAASAQELLQAFYNMYNITAWICDREGMLASCGQVPESAHQTDEQTLALIDGRRPVSLEKETKYLVPITASCDAIGGVIIRDNNISDSARHGAELIARVLALQAE